MGLTKIAINRPVAILMLIGALIVLGWQGLGKMPAEQDPRIDFPFVSVTTVYPGAGPGEIETLVSKPIEDSVSSVNGVKNVTSVSQQGVSVVAIEFQLGVDVDVAVADVRAKVDAARRSLPREVETPTIGKFDTASTPILFMTLRSTAGRPSREIREIAERTVKDQLGQVKGVAAVVVTGGDQREVQVRLNRSRLDAYGLTVSEVARAIQSQNLNVPSGNIREGNRDYAVRVIGEFEDPAEIRDLRLSFPSAGGFARQLRVSDIATVSDSVAERSANASLAERSGDSPLPTSTDTVSISIQKTSDGNTVETARGVKSQLERLKSILPSDLQITITTDQSVRVYENLHEVQVSLILGAVLAVLIVYLFLHNLRGTRIVALSIPTSIVATFLVMYSLGFTLNSMTLLGLSLAVGILVDDSIVVLENIYRHLAAGEPPREAALRGRGEIGLAAVTITLVDVVVFVPVAFMGGIVGQFFRSFGITVAVATLFSLLMSFTLAPMLASLWYRKGEYRECHHGIFGSINRFYGRMENVYRRTLIWSLRHRGSVIYIGNMALVNVVLWMMSAGSGTAGLRTGIMAAGIQVAGGVFVFAIHALRRRRSAEPLVTAGIGAMVSLSVATLAGIAGVPLGFRFAPGQDQSQVALSVELPAGSSLAATTRVLREIESKVSGISEIRYLETSAGQSATGGFGGTTSSGTNFGQVRLILGDRIGTLDRILFWTDTSALRKRSDTDIAEEVRGLVKTIAGADIRTTEVSGFGGSSAPVQIEIDGPDLDALVALARQVKQQLSGTPGILTPDISYKASKPEVQIRLDRTRAADYGLSVADVSQAVRNAIEGNVEAKFRQDGEEYDIRIQYDRLDRASVADVAQIVVGRRGRVPVRVRDVARIVEGRGPTKIDRKNRLRQVTVTAYLAPGKVIGNMQQIVDPKLRQLDWGKASYSWGGEANSLAEEGVFMVAALGLAVVLVYMLMAALFNNLLYPLVIMLSIPQALVGGLLGLLITGKPMSIIAMIGVIMLMGLVTKNAILLVDYTNTLRFRGWRREDALAEAGPTRLRPILMTSLAQILGALPIALALGRGSEFRQPLGIVVMGGLILSGLLTLLVIPCTYTWFDDLSVVVGRLFGRRSAKS